MLSDQDNQSKRREDLFVKSDKEVIPGWDDSCARFEDEFERQHTQRSNEGLDDINRHMSTCLRCDDAFENACHILDIDHGDAGTEERRRAFDKLLLQYAHNEERGQADTERLERDLQNPEVRDLILGLLTSHLFAIRLHGPDDALRSRLVTSTLKIIEGKWQKLEGIMGRGAYAKLFERDRWSHEAELRLLQSMLDPKTTP